MRSPRALLAAGAVSTVAALLGFGLLGVTGTSGARAASGASADGAFTLLNGGASTLRAYAGRPVMVWFVADGCASCAASIPAVAAHLSAFAKARTHILVLGLYGAFASGRRGRAQLASFGRGAAGPRFKSSVWTWGMASPALTLWFDPHGIPDLYFLRNRVGRTVYRGGLPVITIAKILSHLKELS